MSTCISFFILATKNAVPLCYQIDKNDDNSSNNWERSQNDQRHFPSHCDCDSSSTNKHCKQIEHTTYFLASCSLISQGVIVKIGWKFELIRNIIPSYILAQQTFHVSFTTLYCHPLTEYSPRSESYPGWSECS